MKKDELIKIFSAKINIKLATDLVSEFLELKADCTTQTLGRAPIGKFVETVVQCLQYLESRKYDVKPNVDDFLKNLENRASSLDDGLKICCSRIARAIYTLRNKRNILHKGDVDPNLYDLILAFNCAQWIMTELVRQTAGLSMAEAGKTVGFLQLPIGPQVEEIDGRKIIYGNVTVEEEVLIYLHSHYPVAMPLPEIKKSLDRRANSSISNALKKLWQSKSVHKDDSGKFKLTKKGYSKTVQILTESQT